MASVSRQRLVSQANAQPIVLSSLTSVVSGKSDRLDVNRAAKGSLLIAIEPQPQLKGFSSISDFLSSGEER